MAAAWSRSFSDLKGGWVLGGARPPALPFDFSGILYANYQYGGTKGNRTVNRFDVERAYLTFRATPGEHFAIRITATSTTIV